MRRQFAAISMFALAAAGCAEEGPSAYIDFNLVPDQECIYSADGDVTFFGVGRYDISTSGRPALDTGYCARSYFLHLRVNSALRKNADEPLGRAEPNVLQINQVEVTLRDVGTGAVIDFTRGSTTLPNPFLVTTTISLEPSDGDEPSRNVASFEAIPSSYAPLLNNFVGGQVLAEVQLYGTTLGDVNVDFKPYSYPIQICEGCLSLCEDMDLIQRGRTREDVIPDNVCDDDAGADGRVCIDPGC